MIKRITSILIICFLLVTMFSFSCCAVQTQAGTTGVSLPENVKNLLEFLELADVDSLNGSELTSYEVFCEAYMKISGVTAEEIENKSCITYAYVIRNLISLLGYDSYASVMGGYPYGYITVANKTGLLDGITVTNFEQDFVDNDSFCMLLYNALMTEMYVIDGVSGENTYEYSYTTGDTLLEEIFGIAFSEGVLNGTEKTDIYGEFLSEDEIKIDGVKMQYTGKPVHHLTGYRVEYFYEADSSGMKVLFVTKHDEQKITTVYSDEIIGVSGPYFKYEPENSGTEKSIRIPVGTHVLKNGVFAGYTGTLDESANLNVTRGRIDFIDNDNKGGIDCISITEYDVRVADFVNTSLEIIYLKNGFGMLSLGEQYASGKKEVEYSIRLNGLEVPVDEVTKWDALLIAHSENNSGKLFYDIEIVRRTVSGTLTGADDDALYIDDERYTIAPSFDKSKIKLGFYGEFIIAGNDDIADVKSVKNYVYGFVMKTGSGKGLQAENMLKLMTESGKPEIMSLCEKVKLNGSVVSDEEVIKFLENKYMLIAYRTNTEGKITTVFTDRSMGKVENEFSMDADHTSNDGTYTGNDRFGVYRDDVFVYSEPFFNALYQPSAQCVIFYVHPDVIDKSKAPEDDEIYVGGSTSIKNMIDVTSDAENYFVRAQMFDTDEFYRADAIVIYRDDISGGSVSLSYEKVMVIDSVTAALVNGEECYKVRYYKNGSTDIETAYADSDELKKANSFSNYPFRHHDKINSFGDLKCGDVIQAGTNKDGNITTWRPLYIMDAQYNDGEYWGNGVYYFANTIELISTSVKKVEDMNFIGTSIDAYGKAHDRYFRITSGDMAECFVYDRSLKKLTKYPDMSILNEIVPGVQMLILQSNKRIMMQIVIK